MKELKDKLREKVKDDNFWIEKNGEVLEDETVISNLKDASIGYEKVWIFGGVSLREVEFAMILGSVDICSVASIECLKNIFVAKLNVVRKKLILIMPTN